MSDEKSSKIYSDDDFLQLGASPIGEAIDKLDIALTGLEEGATLGFADELKGLTAAGMDLAMAGLHNIAPKSFGPSPTQIDESLIQQGFKGDLSPSTLDIYREFRNKARQEQKQASEQNPELYTAANIGGSLLTGGLTAGLGSAIVPAVSETAGLGSQIMRSALSAVPVGAASAAGLSESSNIPELASDIGKGASSGAAMGAISPVIAQLPKISTNLISKTKTGQELLDAYQKVKSGVKLDSPDFLKSHRDELKQQSEEIYLGLKDKIKDVFAEKENILNNLEKDGIKADIEPIFKDLKLNIQSSKALNDDEQKIFDKVLKKYEPPEVDPLTNQKIVLSKGPLEIENTLKELKDLKSKMQTPSGIEALDEAVNSLKELQTNMHPSIQENNNKLFQLIDTTELLTSQSPLAYQDRKGMETIKTKLADQFEKSGGYKQESFFDQLLSKGGQTSKKAEVEPLKKIAPEIAKKVSEGISIAKDMDLAKKVQQPFGSISKMIKSGGAKIGTTAAKASLTAEDFLTKGSNYLTNLSNDKINDLANKMINNSSETTKAFGRVLAEIPNKSQIGKNALLFSLMQQPEFRKIFNDPNSEFKKILETQTDGNE